MSDIAIRVENLGKMYRIGAEEKRPDNLWQATKQLVASPFDYLRRITRPPTEEETLWALKDVSFEVQRGEVVGVIGRNGAGKSTLLKILSRITEPTTGHAEIHGRVGSLLEVGTGFHPELTGRENIYLNGAILGMKREEIDRKFDEIVDFSGVEKFIDTPVKRYSSGMRVRLGFAVAAHLDPEILLIDEVLSVGDVAFQRKCVGKMEDVTKQGRTVLFVSHNMASISSLCSTCLYLDRGGIGDIGHTERIIHHYLQDFEDTNQKAIAYRNDRKGTGQVRITGLRFLDAESRQSLTTVISGQDIVIEVAYESRNLPYSTLERFNIGLTFLNDLGQFLVVLNSQMADHAFETLPVAGRVYCYVPRCPLMAGRFYITTTLKVKGVLMDQVENATTIDVETGDFFGTGIPNAYGRQGIFIDQSWSSETPKLHVVQDTRT